MVLGLLSDINIEGHVARLVVLMHKGYRAEFWHHLALSVRTFEEAGLTRKDSDARIWHVCQERKLVLITANRNQEAADSLETTIRECVKLDSLPVVTLADSGRFRTEQSYAEAAADALLGYLFSIDLYLGSGRLFIP